MFAGLPRHLAWADHESTSLPHIDEAGAPRIALISLVLGPLPKVRALIPNRYLYEISEL